MKNGLSKSAAALIGSVTGLLTMAVLSSSTWAGNNNPHVMPPHAFPFGKSYHEWSAQWWKWQLAMPATDHPAFSLDGANCAIGQSGKVWFLTGTFTSEVPENEFSTVVRELCSVPVGKAIFFPIINIECSSIEAPPFRGETSDERRICAEEFVVGPSAVISDLSVEIDGTSLQHLDDYRFQSPEFRFEFDDPDDNILGVDCNVQDCADARSVSDGYWVMLPPLSRGTHTIRFTGSFRDAETNDLFFGLDVTYTLEIVRRGR